jgi:predicted RNase H-like nuclease (RuvC/YqgF family)
MKQKYVLTCPVKMIGLIRELHQKIEEIREKNNSLDQKKILRNKPVNINDFDTLVNQIKDKDEKIIRLKKQCVDLIENNEEFRRKNSFSVKDRSIYSMTIQLQDEKIRRLESKNLEKNRQIDELELQIKKLKSDQLFANKNINELREQRNEAWKIKEGLTAEGLALIRNRDEAIKFIDKYSIISKTCDYLKKVKDLLNGKYPKASDKFKVS